MTPALDSLLSKGMLWDTVLLGSVPLLGAGFLADEASAMRLLGNLGSEI